MAERIDPDKLRISEPGLAILKEREGFYETSKPDVGGLVVGYAMQRWKGKPVTRGLKVTKEEADAEMRRQIEEHYGKLVRDELTRPITQDEFDALVSVAYNSERAGANLAKRLNKGQALTQEHFTASGTVDGKPYAPLQLRRKREYAQFARGHVTPITEAAVEPLETTEPATLPGDMTARQGLAAMMGGPIPKRTRHPSATPTQVGPPQQPSPLVIPESQIIEAGGPFEPEQAPSGQPPSDQGPMRPSLDEAIGAAIARKRGGTASASAKLSLDEAIAATVAKKTGAKAPTDPYDLPRMPPLLTSEPWTAGQALGAALLARGGARIGGAMLKPGLKAAGRIAAGATAMAGEAAPLIKYEVGTQILKKVGVPEPVAEIIAAIFTARSGVKGKAAQGEAAGAGRAATGPIERGALGTIRQAPPPPTYDVMTKEGRLAARKAATAEYRAAQGVPPQGYPSAGSPAARAGAPVVTPPPPPSPAPPTSPSGAPVGAPGAGTRTLGELATAAKMKLTADEFKLARQLTQQFGLTPQEAQRMAVELRHFPASMRKLEYLEPFVKQVIKQANEAGRMPPR